MHELTYRYVIQQCSARWTTPDRRGCSGQRSVGPDAAVQCAVVQRVEGEEEDELPTHDVTVAARIDSWGADMRSGRL